MKTLAWGIIGAGNIAKAFADALPHSRTGRLVAVASRERAKAEAFAKEFNAPEAYGSYQELLDDPQIDAVYVATPHPMHAEWAIKAADAKKHILCEKPLALNYMDAQAIVEAARRNDVFLMEAFMYRCNPQTQKLVELIREKVIGDVRLIRANFSFDAGFNLESRLLKNRLGGGGILDVGCYATSMARLIAGAALGKDFEEPLEVKAVGRVGPESHSDEWTIATLKFPGDILAQCATGVRLGLDNDVVIFGSAGSIRVPSPWFCAGRKGGTSQIIVQRRGVEKPDEIRVEADWLYAHEIDTVGENLARRQGPSPAMSWDDTLGNLRTLDRWREQIGMAYELEQLPAYAEPLDKRPLKIREPNRMPYGELAGVKKKISRLVMGSMVFRSASRTAVACDEFFARGGNCFDTAFCYGPVTQKNFGAWMKMRGLREQVVLIAKGAHPPGCTPQGMHAQLLESLDMMQTDYADVYFLHRDNLGVPVGEWVDALDAEVQAGRIRTFGGSNWTQARIDAANEYARQHQRQGFSAVSNNFSLARMVKAVWDGCLASSEPAFRQWHIEKQFPLFAWSSQARGFFVPGRAAPDKLEDKSLVESWYSDDNFQRQRRCFELAKKKGVEPVAIALAYVLHQAFPVFALIGPADLAEIRTSFDALDVKLTPDEVKWLNLE